MVAFEGVCRLMKVQGEHKVGIIPNIRKCRIEPDVIHDNKKKIEIVRRDISSKVWIICTVSHVLVHYHLGTHTHELKGLSKVFRLVYSFEVLQIDTVERKLLKTTTSMINVSTIIQSCIDDSLIKAIISHEVKRNRVEFKVFKWRRVIPGCFVDNVSDWKAETQLIGR
jgi:hypothetical protein